MAKGMDFATLLGLVAGGAVIAYAIYLGGSFAAFVDFPSVLIVVAGGFAATLIRFPLIGVVQALGLGARTAFLHDRTEPRELILQLAQMSEVVRRTGPLGLESFEVVEPNLKKGAQYIADGYDPGFIRDTMELARDRYLTRLSEGQRVFKSLGDATPAFGMIGTLVGLVQMLGNMEDPSAIGPAMAVALLTTLYGAVLANLVCLPMADKLGAKLDVEEINQTLIIDGVLAVREGMSPVLLREKLIGYLPENQHQAMAEAA